MNKTGIAFVIGSMGNARAGTERSLLTLIENLDKARFAPLLVSLQDCEYIQSKKFVCETHCLHLYRMFTPKMFRDRRQLAALLGERNIRVVQTFFVEAHLVGGGAAKIAGISGVISSRRNLGYGLGGKEKLYLRHANRYPARWLANSQAVAAATSQREGVPLEMIDVIYNGVNVATPIAETNADSQATQRVVLTANLRPVKSVETLLKAAPAVIERFPRVRFEIIGEGDERRPLEQLANRMGLKQHLIFHGSRPDVSRLLESASIGVLTSTSEGFSNSLLEYMRAGLPIVATAVGGNKEAVVNGKTGFLIPPQDHAALAQKLNQLLQDSQLRREMGGEGRRLLEEKFSLKRMIESHQDYYESIAAGGQAQK